MAKRNKGYRRGYESDFDSIVDISVKSAAIPIRIAAGKLSSTTELLKAGTEFIKSINVDEQLLAAMDSLSEDEIKNAIKKRIAFSEIAAEATAEYQAAKKAKQPVTP